MATRGTIDASPLTLPATRNGTVSRKKRSTPWTNRWLLRTLSVCVVVALWQVVGAYYPYTTSNPTAVWKSAVATFLPDVLPAFGYTLSTFGIGFAICIVAGIPIGFAMARIKLVRLVIEPYTVMLFSVPFLALFPVLLLAFGVSFGLRVSVVVLTGIFPIIVNTFLGAQRVDPQLADVGRTFVASPWKTLTTIIVPGSLPYVFAGIRVGFARGMIGAVVVELEASAVGVGSLLERDGQNLAMDNFFVILLLLGVFSLGCTVLIQTTSSWSTEPWKRRHRRRTTMTAQPSRPGRAITPATTPIERHRSALEVRLNEAARRVAMAWSRVRPALDNRAVAWTIRILVLVGIIAYWQYKSQFISRAVLPSPWRVATSAYHLIFVTHELFGPALNSLTVLVMGFALSVVVGIPVGLLMGRSTIAESVLDPYVSFIYALPHVAFVPLMIVWLGYETPFRVAYVFISAVFPVIINTMSGVKNIDHELIDTGRSFGASRTNIMRTIIIPGATPFMIAGARLAFSAAWVGVVVAEILSTEQGLGGLITKFSDSYQTAEMFVPIVVIMAIAVLILQVTAYLQKHLTPWHQTDTRR